MKIKAGPACEMHGITKAKTLCHHLYVNDTLVHYCFIGCELHATAARRTLSILPNLLIQSKLNK